ncbi:class I SAM-dependent methyltransferase [Thermaurantiacus sp.]
MHRLLRFLTLLGLSLLLPFAPSVAQDPLTLLQRHPLESPERGVIAHRDAIVRALGIKPGTVVADIGAGTGAFMEPLARAVGPGGRYIGVDIDKDYVKLMESRAKRLGLAQASVVLSRPDSITLPADSVDLMVVIDAYHHFAPPEPMLASMLKALRPGGQLVIVDFDRTPNSPRWLREHVRADKATFLKEMEAAGFRIDRDLKIPGLEGHFATRLLKP